jgi:hypothetical protein
MKRSGNPDLDNMHLLKSATALLMQRAIEALDNEGKFDNTSGVFGKAAPFATLESMGRLIMALAQVENGSAPADKLIPALSGEDAALVKSLLMHAHKRQLEDGRKKLPAPVAE